MINYELIQISMNSARINKFKLIFRFSVGRTSRTVERWVMGDDDDEEEEQREETRED